MENHSTALMTVPSAGMGALAVSDATASMAEVQAQMIIAKMYPRNVVQAVNKIENAFTRPKLAEAATYVYARGGTNISGPSIRAAEAIAQLYGNITFGFHEVSRGTGPDGVGFSEVMAVAWDLENNTKRALKFQVRHWRDTWQGGYPLKDERDIYELIANQAQRRVRSCILAVIPGDIVDIALEQADVTLKTNVEITKETVKALLDSFLDEHGVTQAQIEKFIQRNIAAIEPAQYINLRRIYANLRDGLAQPENWFEMPEEGEAEETPAEGQKTRAASVKAAAKKAKESSAVEEPQGGTLPVAGEVNAETGEVTMTFAQVNDMLVKAKTLDDLDAAASFISSVKSEQHREELSKVYQSLRHPEEAE